MRKLGRNEKFVAWNKRNFICMTNFTILINRVVVWNSIEYSLMITGVVFVISKPANIWLSIGPANIWQHLVLFSAKFHVSFEGFWKNCAPNIDRSKIDIFKRFLKAHNSGVWCHYVMRMEDMVVSWPSLSYVYAGNIKSSLANIRRLSPNVGIFDPFLNLLILAGSGSFKAFVLNYWRGRMILQGQI